MHGSIHQIDNQRKLVVGCPPGGKLTVLLWSVVFDGLLNKVKTAKVNSVGFVNDGALIIIGSDLDLVYTQMNNALAKTDEWAKENGLKLSPTKTVAMLFIRKTKYTLPITQLRIGGNTLTSQKQT